VKAFGVEGRFRRLDESRVGFWHLGFFRDCLSVHSTYGLSYSSSRLSDPLHRRLQAASSPPRTLLRLLPAGATVAGWARTHWEIRAFFSATR